MASAQPKPDFVGLSGGDGLAARFGQELAEVHEVDRGSAQLEREVGELVRLDVAVAMPHLACDLRDAALSHSNEMVSQSYFEHTSPAGLTFMDRIESTGYMSGARSWTVGENLVWGGPEIGAARAFRLWLASPPHRANLLDPHWREIGLGAVHATSAPGVYGGGSATIVTADFGARSR